MKHYEGYGDALVFSCGRRYKGKALLDVAAVDPSYLEWMKKRKFSAEVMAEVHKAQDAVKANPDARPKQPVADGNNSATPDGFIKWRVVDGQMTQVLALGMHAGTPVEDVARADPGYVEWMAGPSADFIPEVKYIASTARRLQL